MLNSIRKTSLYSTWRGMKQRCRDKNAHNYQWYGGRGIKVCDSWKDSFECFYYDMIDTHKPGLELDRIDNNGNYSKENCIWRTRKQQNNNARSNHKIKYNGKIQNMSKRAEELGIHYDTIRGRINRGWSPKKTFETPIINGKKAKKITYKGQTKTLLERSKTLGINTSTIINRIKRGRSIERTLSS